MKSFRLDVAASASKVQWCVLLIADIVTSVLYVLVSTLPSDAMDQALPRLAVVMYHLLRPLLAVAGVVDTEAAEAREDAAKAAKAGGRTASSELRWLPNSVAVVRVVRKASRPMP